MNCEYCDGPLVKIGKARANGKDHIDWESRRYHKKCFKELQTQRRIEDAKLSPLERLERAMAQCKRDISLSPQKAANTGS